jgi:hypothetical protein
MPHSRKAVELVFDEPGQFGPGAGLGVGDEGGCGLLNQAVWRALLEAVTFVVERGTIRRPLGLPADALHARRPTW